MATREARSRATKAYKERMESEGYVKTCVWVPREFQDELIDYGAYLRRQKLKKGVKEP